MKHAHCFFFIFSQVQCECWDDIHNTRLLWIRWSLFSHPLLVFVDITCCLCPSKGLSPGTLCWHTALSPPAFPTPARLAHEVQDHQGIATDATWPLTSSWQLNMPPRLFLSRGGALWSSGVGGASSGRGRPVETAPRCRPSNINTSVLNTSPRMQM